MPRAWAQSNIATNKPSPDHPHTFHPEYYTPHLPFYVFMIILSSLPFFFYCFVFSLPALSLSLHNGNCGQWGADIIAPGWG